MAAGIVLAGRPNTGRLREAAPECAWEASIPLAGMPMAAHVAAALAGTVGIDRIVVAGPAGVAGPGALYVEPGADLPETLRAALASVPGDEDEVVMAAGDAPLLTPAAVSDLLAACRRRALDFGYPIVSRATCEADFPGVRRTYVRLREGAFTGGNCFYARRAAIPGLLRLVERVYAARKRPLRLAAILGPGLLLGLAFGTVGIARAERAGSRLLGRPAGAVPSAHAGVGVDVDKPSDLELCRAVFAAAAADQRP